MHCCKYLSMIKYRYILYLNRFMSLSKYGWIDHIGHINHICCKSDYRRRMINLIEIGIDQASSLVTGVKKLIALCHIFISLSFYYK